MKAFALTLSLACLLLAACSASSPTEPSALSHEAGELMPTGGECNPDASPC